MRSLGLLGAMVALIVPPAEASAIELGARSTPVAYAQRSMVLRKGQLRVDAGPPDFALLDSGLRNDDRSAISFALRDLGGSDETFVGFGIGLGYGVIKDLEIGTLLIPVLLSPDVEYGDMEFYGRYRFIHEKDFEFGAQAAISLPTNTDNNQTNFGMVFGVPALFRFSSQVRLDVGAEFELIFGDADGLVNLDIPAALQFQVTRHWFVGPKSGVLLANMEEIEIGAGVVTGITLSDSRGRPFVDLLGEFYWPFFIASGREDAVNLVQFNLVFGARVFFDFPARELRPPTRKSS